jgi:DNA-binding XRE family transcriptional regulator
VYNAQECASRKIFYPTNICYDVHGGASMYEVGRCLLRYRLKEAKMSQRDLAIKVGKSETTISDYIANRQKMSYATAYSIAKVLHCHMEDLYEMKLKR